MSDEIPHIPLNEGKSERGVDNDSGTEETNSESQERAKSSTEDVSFITANEYDRERHEPSKSNDEVGLTERDIENAVKRGTKIVDNIPGHEEFHETSMNIFWGRCVELGKDKTRSTPKYDHVVVTDTDPDGKGVAALYQHEYGDRILALPASYRYGKEPLEALQVLQQHIPEGVTVYICDLGPNEELADEWIETIGSLQETNPVKIRDHHERVDEIYNAFDDMENVEYVLDQSVCATMIVLREDVTNPTRDIVELAAITNVQDIHIPDSPHFDEWVPELRVASRALSFAVYVKTACEKGIDFIHDDSYSEYFETYRNMMRDMEDLVLETLDVVTINGYRVGFVYGNSHPDRPAEIMKQEHGCDIACLLKPNGRMSIRSDIDTAPFSNEIAELFDGGGHTDSAGCVVFEMYDSDPPVDRDEHYETGGAKQREVVEEKLRDFLESKPELQ